MAQYPSASLVVGWAQSYRSFPAVYLSEL